QFDARVNAARSVSVYAGKDLNGSITAKKQFTISAIGDLNATLTSQGDADGDNSASTWGKLTGNINAASSLKVFAYGDVTGTITTAPAPYTNPSLNVDLQTYGALNGKVTSAGDAKIFAANGVTQDVTATDDVNVISWNGVSGKLTAGNTTATSSPPLTSPADSDEHVLVVSSRGVVSGKLFGQNGIVVDAFGNITSDLTAPSGSIQATARVYVAPTAEGQPPPTDGTDSDITGVVSAARGVTLAASGKVSSQTVSGSTVTIGAGGDISSTTVTATAGPVNMTSYGGVSTTTITGTAITIGAAKDVTSTTITASTGAVSIETDGALDVSSGGGAGGGGGGGDDGDGNSNSPPSNPASGIAANGTNGSITLVAGEGIMVDVSAMGNITISSGDSVAATGSSTAGSITVSSQNNVSNSTLTAPLTLSVTSYGTVQGSTLTSTTSSVNVFGANGLSTLTVQGQSGVDASTLMDVTGGSYKSGAGEVDLYAGDDISSVEIQAQSNAEVEASDDISGTIKSLADNIDVESAHGSITATMTSNDNATVTTLAGNVSGTITATTGNILVNAGGSVTKTISASAGTVEVDALDDIVSPQILASGKITISALGTITGESILSFLDDVSVSAGEDIGTDITAGKNASVTSWLGSVLNPITAANGEVDVWAGGNIEQYIIAGLDANVLALGDINNPISAGGTASVTSAGGSVIESVDAGLDASVFAFSTVTGPVTAGRDADVESLDTVVGEINAGRDVTGTSGGTWQSPVIAGRNATIYAIGNFNANVTAPGNISIGTEGTFQGGAASGINLSVYSYSGASGTLNAGDNLNLNCMDTSSALLTAGGDIDATVAGLMTGTADAVGNIDIFGFDTVSVLVTAGGDASVFAGKDIDHSVTAGGAASVTALGSVSGINVTGGTSASLFAVQGVTTCNVTGPDASLVSWDVVGGPSMVTGSNSAFAYSFNDFNGSVSSSAGTAGVICIGNFVGGVSAGTDAAVMTDDSFTGSISAVGSVGAVTIGGFSGTITAGLDTVLLSQASISGSVSAGEDGSILASGTLSGTMSAGRDLEAEAYGDLTATLTAGRDITGVTAVGNLSSMIVAGRNVGDITTFGDFTGSIAALDPGDDPDGGKIGNIIAQGTMSGSMTAAHQIGDLLSGDAITTSTTAPDVGSTLPFDSTYFVTNVSPNVPASMAADILADANDAKNGVLSDKVTFQSQTNDLLNQVLLDHLGVLTSIASSRADQLAAITQARADNQQAIDDVRNSMLDGLHQAQTDSDTARDTMINGVLADASTFAAQFAGPTGSNADAHAQGVTDAKQENARMSTELDQALRDQVKATGDANQLSRVQADWYTLTLTAISNGTDNASDSFLSFMRDPVGGTQAMIDRQMKASVDNWIQRSEELFANHQAIVDAIDANGATGFNQAAQIAAWHLASATGVRTLITGFTGQDPITGQRYRSSDRFYQVIGGAAQLAETILGAASIYSRLTSPCKSWIFGECFVGDTLVVVAKDTPPGTTVAIASAESSTSQSPAWVDSPVIFVAIGLAGFAVLERRKQTHSLQRRNRIRPKQQTRSDQGNLPIANSADDLAKSRNNKLTQNSNAPNMNLNAARLETDKRPDKSEDVAQAEPSRNVNASVGDSVFANLTIATQDSDHQHEMAGTRWEAKIIGDLETEEISAGSSPKYSAGVVWLVACLTLAFGSFLPTFSWREISNNQATASNPAPAVPAPTLKYREIQEIRTGMRVIAENPELKGLEIPDTDFDSPNWRNIHLTIEKPDGTEVAITLLRSVQWLQQRTSGWSLQDLENAGTTSTKPEIDLDLEELGAVGIATILSIEPCPTIETGPGRVVTATFRHSSAKIIDLYVSGEPKPIGTTENHPFWSVDSRTFVPASTLQSGQKLCGINDSIANVQLSHRRSNSQSVYNLEVDGQHVYHVGTSGVLVHNSCWKDYENGINAKLNARSQIAFTGVNSGRNRIADGLLPGNIAVESKYIGNWKTSPYNPIRTTALARQKQVSLVLQMRDYAASMPEVHYYTNNLAMQAHLQDLAKQLNLANVKVFFDDLK
ncbi:MAG: hypothetical protein JWM11_7955, partial [Planctomycetaceae bacterium]|nr:hypothetical protein [Planctomycetaceae bacterium]